MNITQTAGLPSTSTYCTQISYNINMHIKNNYQLLYISVYWWQEQCNNKTIKKVFLILEYYVVYNIMLISALLLIQSYPLHSLWTLAFHKLVCWIHCSTPCLPMTVCFLHNSNMIIRDADNATGVGHINKDESACRGDIGSLSA